MDAARALEDEWSRLLGQAQKGEREAYRRFLIEALPFLRATARRFGGRGDEEVEEIVQETLLTVHRVLHTYDPQRPVRPWLTAIVARRSVDLRRRAGRIASREVHDPRAYETFGEPAAKEDQLLTGSMDQMLETLSPQQRQALQLVKLQELSLAEASARSGQSVSALKVNVHRALKKLRQRLGGSGGE